MTDFCSDMCYSQRLERAAQTAEHAESEMQNSASQPLRTGQILGIKYPRIQGVGKNSIHAALRKQAHQRNRVGLNPPSRGKLSFLWQRLRPSGQQRMVGGGAVVFGRRWASRQTNGCTQPAVRQQHSSGWSA